MSTKGSARETDVDDLNREIDPATAAFFKLLPNTEMRTAVAEIFAESIREAHKASPGSWVLSYSPTHDYVGFDAGKVFALNLEESTLTFLLDPEPVNLSDPRFASWAKPSKTPEFKSNPNLTWRLGPIAEVIEHWDAVKDAHLAAVRQAAGKVEFSTFAKHHQEELCEEVGRIAGVDLPRPRRRPIPGYEMDDLLWLVNRPFENWGGFSDPRFVKAEITFKRDAAELANELLSRGAIESLIQGKDYDEILKRLDKVAHATNLLFLGVPSQGDLAILHTGDLNEAEFCERLLELLYGGEDSADRLDEFGKWAEANGLPNKWTFPTYFLFLLHPESDLFIKPTAIKRFLSMLNPADTLEKSPSGSEYARVRDIARGLYDSLAEYEPQNLIDIQGFIWVCASVRFWKIAPGEGARLWEGCSGEGYIGLGWDEIGDLAGIKSKKDYDARIAQFISDEPGWTKDGLKQLWAFYSQVGEGDVIVANQGTKAVLGIGTVTGRYYFADGEEYGHRVPVRWDETTPRKVEFGGWRKTLIELSPKDFLSVMESPVIDSPNGGDGVFTPRAFELLALLHDRPQKSVYNEYRSEFSEHVERPFQKVMNQIAAMLPEPILDLMETERRVFARILKNDFGRGGAWPFYWGAFYPKGGKRIEDAQLYLVLNHEGLDFGFFIGEYGSKQKRRFVANSATHRTALERVFRDHIDSGKFVFGSWEDFFPSDLGGVSESMGWREWIAQPAEKGIRVGVLLGREQVLKLTREELVEQIGETFERLFPLVYLAISDDPLPLIAAYIDEGMDDEHDIAPDYSLETMVEETGFDLAALMGWVGAIDRKGQGVLYGPPGTGKTFVAERLARHLVGGGNGFVELVQFHPAYAYEDFIQGLRPEAREDGGLDYRLMPGRFLEFCRRASGREGRCVLIIDEINRANLSRVFGELMYLLEYREKDIPLAGGERLQIPKNVRLIGTMNTADRSIALVDHALRRRFAFIALYPQYKVLNKFHSERGYDAEKLIQILQRVNRAIDDPHYEVGISFFLMDNLTEHLGAIWRMEIEPYLEEYFFDQPGKVDEFRWDKVAEKVL